jgi:hypothetical protein
MYKEGRIITYPNPALRIKNKTDFKSIALNKSKIYIYLKIIISF